MSLCYQFQSISINIVIIVLFFVLLLLLSLLLLRLLFLLLLLLFILLLLRSLFIKILMCPGCCTAALLNPRLLTLRLGPASPLLSLTDVAKIRTLDWSSYASRRVITRHVHHHTNTPICRSLPVTRRGDSNCSWTLWAAAYTLLISARRCSHRVLQPGIEILPTRPSHPHTRWQDGAADRRTLLRQGTSARGHLRRASPPEVRVPCLFHAFHVFSIFSIFTIFSIVSMSSPSFPFFPCLLHLFHLLHLLHLFHLSIISIFSIFFDLVKCTTNRSRSTSRTMSRPS